MEFFELLDEYNILYNNCLHKNEKQEIEEFVQELSKNLKNNNKKAVKNKVSSKYKNLLKDMNWMILEELEDLEKYSGKFDTEDESYSAYL